MLRKIAILVGAFALTLGAWAETVTYTFKLTIDDIPLNYERLGANATYYLVNEAESQVYMYCKSSEWDWAKPDEKTGSIGLLRSYEHTGGETINIGGKQYTVVAHTIDYTGSNINNKDGTDQGKKVEFITQFKVEGGLTYNDYGMQQVTYAGTTEPRNVGMNLAMIVDDPDNEYFDHQSYYQEFGDVGYQDKQFATVGAFSNDVPEPTSGVLLLLGVAGLALRRRRVA